MDLVNRRCASACSRCWTPRLILRSQKHPAQRLVPLPEGARYLGFTFATAVSPEAVEAALRESHAQLEFVIEPFVDREGGRTSQTVKSTEAV